MHPWQLWHNFITASVIHVVQHIHTIPIEEFFFINFDTMTVYCCSRCELWKILSDLLSVDSVIINSDLLALYLPDTY